MATAFALGLSIFGIARGAAHTIPSDAAQRPPAGEFLDLDGQPLKLFEPAGPASVIFFVATDCPISNWYAPEIQSICRDYQARGISCSLAYEDVDLTNSGARLNEKVRAHLQEFRYAGIPATVDISRGIARRKRPLLRRRSWSIMPARSGTAAESTTSTQPWELPGVR